MSSPTTQTASELAEHGAAVKAGKAFFFFLGGGLTSCGTEWRRWFCCPARWGWTSSSLPAAPPWAAPALRLTGCRRSCRGPSCLPPPRVIEGQAFTNTRFSGTFKQRARLHDHTVCAHARMHPQSMHMQPATAFMKFINIQVLYS